MIRMDVMGWDVVTNVTDVIGWDGMGEDVMGSNGM